MKALQQKLALLQKTSGAGPRPRPAGSTAPEALERLQTVLGGQLVPTARGEIFVVSRRYHLSSRHGQARYDGALRLEPGILTPVYHGLGDLRIERALFFDTETTGLAGGSGTYAFLVGLAYYQGEELVTEQLLMRDHRDEAAMLELLAQRLQQCHGLVSYNGKTFDAQLLATRFAMHRRRDPLAEQSHLDLLHLCRRVWGQASLPDCRLETLEHRVLGAPRQDDTPGWQIPELFFNFLRDRDPRPLRGVIEHNRRDLLAMVGLCAVLAQLLEADHPDELAVPAAPEVLLALARLWAHLGQPQRGDRFFRAALRHPVLPPEPRLRGMMSWARELKRRGQQEKASALWRSVLTRAPGHPEATIELAKWLEHQRRDFSTALTLVRGCLGMRPEARWRRDLEQRQQRLEARLARQESAS